MKVWVITKGYYNNIIGVVETEEEAKEIAKCYRGNNDWNDDIQIIKCDTKKFITKNFAFSVTYDTLEKKWYVELNEYLDDKYKGFERQNMVITTDDYVIFARSVEEAVKIAQDMRAEKIAEKERVIF